uniref:leishmanolysin-like peptidase n=1 Tax=Halichoerus grypus TaxID=9711 RepID=UPI001659472D|nr:leishmanolysin-like peptidase [Halichoerus grypus]
MVTTLGPKMAAEWNGVAGSSGSGPGPSQWSWSRSLWVRGVLLLLGGLWARSTSIPLSLDSSPPCRHHVPSETEVINKVHLKANHVVKRDVDEHLRIKTVYDKSIDELLPEKRYLVKNKLFPQAISYLEKTFQVRRPSGTILLSRDQTARYLKGIRKHLLDNVQQTDTYRRKMIPIDTVLGNLQSIQNAAQL